MLAELRDEQIVVRVQLRSGVFETRLDPPDTSLPLNADQRRFNDDRWHRLVVSREAREVTLPSCLFVRPFVSLFLGSPFVPIIIPTVCLLSLSLIDFL